MTEVTVRGEGISLDLLLWRMHGVRGREVIAETLASNRHIARSAVHLAPGTVVSVPDLPPPSSATRPVVTLFG